MRINPLLDSRNLGKSAETLCTVYDCKALIKILTDNIHVLCESSFNTFSRRAAARASLLYFILNDIYKINPMYQFSLKAYSVVFKDALARAEPADDLEGRVRNLLDNITFSVFVYTSRGLFERDKLVFLFLITLQVRHIDYYQEDRE